jgi:peroxiredoxin
MELSVRLSTFVRDGRIQYIGHLADERLDAAVVAARRAPVMKVAGVNDGKGKLENTSHHGPGDRAPQFTTKTLDGSLFSLQEAAQDQPTVLVFLSPWCESYLATSRAAIAAKCREVREQVDVLAGQNPRVRWLGIASGIWATSAELSKYQADRKVKIALTLDESGALFHQFGVMRVPTIVIIDRGGTIKSRIDGNDARLPSQLQSVALGM